MSELPFITQTELRAAAEHFLQMVRGMMYDPYTHEEVFSDPVAPNAGLGRVMNVQDGKLVIRVASYRGYTLRFYFDMTTVRALLDDTSDLHDFDIIKTDRWSYEVKVKIGPGTLLTI